MLAGASGPWTDEELVARLPERDVNNALQIGPNGYLLLNPLAVQANHSCVPNTGIDRRLNLIALRDIDRGEEITWDYSTSMDDGWTMACRCGEDLCRETIEDFKRIPRSVAERYAGLGVVLPQCAVYLTGHMAD